MKPFIYLTHDGVLDHIGQSQVFPYLKIYSRYTKVFLISFEKKKNIKKAFKLKNSKECENIHWIILTYHKNIIFKIFDFLNLLINIITVLKKYKLSLIHCRSYFPTLITYFLSFFFRIKYIFDIRDFWADEGIEIKKFKFIYRFVKKIEGGLINKSAHIVCLTNAAKNYIFQNYNIDLSKITVIPCGTDFDLFNRKKLDKYKLLKISRDLKLKNKKVLLYYGSLGENYLINKMINFFKYLKSENNDWIFMFVINNGHNHLENILKKNNFQKRDFRILKSSRVDLPKYLFFADLSVFFYRSGMRSIGCSPTKLADLFAMNIPIVTSSDLGDMKQQISLVKNNSLLIDRIYRSKVINGVKLLLSNKSSVQIRKNSCYYNFRFGTKKYIKIYRDIQT